MRRASVLIVLGAASAAAAPFRAAPQAPAVHTAPPGRTAPALPSLPSIARVRIEASAERLLVLEEVNLPRGAWSGGDQAFFVAFGAPGAPRAIDARLVPVQDGSLEADLDALGEPVRLERAPRCPASVQPLLGPPQMAGAVFYVSESSFRRATRPGNMATLRLRSALDVPAEDAQTGRELVVRLGMAEGPPLTIGRLQFVTQKADGVTRVSAQLCGREADPHPLAIALLPPRAGPRKGADLVRIAPVLAVRHASDDLCIRFWTLS